MLQTKILAVILLPPHPEPVSQLSPFLPDHCCLPAAGGHLLLLVIIAFMGQVSSPLWSARPHILLTLKGKVRSCYPWPKSSSKNFFLFFLSFLPSSLPSFLSMSVCLSSYLSFFSKFRSVFYSFYFSKLKYSYILSTFPFISQLLPCTPLKFMVFGLPLCVCACVCVFLNIYLQSA